MSDLNAAPNGENDAPQNGSTAITPAAPNTFDVSAITAVLNIASNSSNVIPTLPVGENEQAGVKGWNPKLAYNYADLADPKAATNGEGKVTTDDDKPGWASTAAKYEWKDEYGDVGPRFDVLEWQLFGHPDHKRAASNVDALREIEVLQEGTLQPNPFWSFDDAGLHPVMRQNIELAHYDRPTPVQAYTIPAILQGFDIVACSQTGSGKTAAYLIPVLSKLMGKAKKLAAPRPLPGAPVEEIRKYRGEPLVLIVAPTRELAVQIFDESRRFCYRSMLRPAVVYGGAPINEQRVELKKGCDVLIGTPGRLCDFMDQPHVLSLNRLKYTIIDEADEMLDASWEPQLKKIMAGGDTNDDSDHTFMMFSATFPKEARKLARDYMAPDHVRIRVGRPGSTHLKVTQQIVWVDQEAKNQALFDLLCDSPPSRTMIFVNDKRSADHIDDYLFNLDLPSTSIHSDRTQREREDAIRSFRTGECPIMVSTGVSARGLDIANIMHVINYDLPKIERGGIDEYIHRIGRTARIGKVGLATSFYNERNEDLGPILVKTLMETKQAIPDFLQHFKPEGDKLDFEDDSDVEDDAAEDAVEENSVEDEIPAPDNATNGVPLATVWE